MSDVAKQLDALLKDAGLVAKFGLRQQGHMQTVERMLRDHASWDAIGKAIGWAGSAVAESFATEQSIEYPIAEATRTEKDFREDWHAVYPCPSCQSHVDRNGASVDPETFRVAEFMDYCPSCGAKLTWQRQPQGGG